MSTSYPLTILSVFSGLALTFGGIMFLTGNPLGVALLQLGVIVGAIALAAVAIVAAVRGQARED